jgi:hypothetical protein
MVRLRSTFGSVLAIIYTLVFTAEYIRYTLNKTSEWMADLGLVVLTYPCYYLGLFLGFDSHDGRILGDFLLPALFCATLLYLVGLLTETLVRWVFCSLRHKP